MLQSCSNPCFSKTILFRGSDGLTGEALVKIVAYHVREQVTDTAVIMGYTSLKLSTIQVIQLVIYLYQHFLPFFFSEIRHCDFMALYF